MASISRVFVWIAGVAIGVQALAFAALHILEPQLGWKSSLITDYAGTEHALVARLSLAAFGITWIAVSIVLRDMLPPGVVTTVVFLLVLLAGLGLVYSATLDARAMDPRLAEGPAAARRILGLLRLALFVSLIVASIQLRSAGLVLLSAATLLLLIVTLAVFLGRGLAGLPQRIVFVMTYAWVLTVLWRAQSGAS